MSEPVLAATWAEFARIYPEFVQWIVQRFGPLPEGNVREADYDRYKAAYEAERLGRAVAS